MIDRLEIMAVAGDLSLRPDVVEKDYVLGWILAGIYADPRLSKVWAFKGGTCLKKCYFETYRFSEDLDFTVLEPAHLEEAFLLAAFADVSRWVQDASGIEIPVEQLRFEPFRNKRGGSNCEGRLYYRGPMQRGGSLQRVKIDLTADERVVLPFADRPVGHPYTDRPEQGMTARCYAFEEVFAEKTRALGERSRPRDLYDVINLFRTEEYRPPSSAVLDVLRQKCAFKGIDLPSLSALALAEDELRADWDAMLGRHAWPPVARVASVRCLLEGPARVLHLDPGRSCARSPDGGPNRCRRGRLPTRHRRVAGCSHGGIHVPGDHPVRRFQPAVRRARVRWKRPTHRAVLTPADLGGQHPPVRLPRRRRAEPKLPTRQDRRRQDDEPAVRPAIRRRTFGHRSDHSGRGAPGDFIPRVAGPRDATYSARPPPGFWRPRGRPHLPMLGLRQEVP